LAASRALTCWTAASSLEKHSRFRPKIGLDITIEDGFTIGDEEMDAQDASDGG
jgi:hypothetical protein